MVLPVGQTDEVQQLIKIEKTEEGPKYSELCDVLFVPLVEGVPGDNGRKVRKPKPAISRVLSMAAIHLG